MFSPFENLGDDQKCELVRLISTMVGETLGRLTIVNEVNRDAEIYLPKDHQELFNTANGWISAFAEIFMERFGSTPLFPFTVRDPNSDRETTVEDGDGLMLYVESIAELVKHKERTGIYEEKGIDVIGKEIRELMEDEAQEELSSQELKRKYQNFNN